MLGRHLFLLLLATLAALATLACRQAHGGSGPSGEAATNDDVDKSAFQNASAPIYAECEKRFDSHLLQLLGDATGRTAPTAAEARRDPQ